MSQYLIDVSLSLESRVSVSSDTYSNFQNWHRWNEYCSFCLTRQMSPFHITYESRIEIHFFFSLPLGLSFLFFVCMREFNCPIRVNAPFCYYCCCLINTVGIRIAMSDKEMRSSWMQGSYPQYTKRNVLILDIVTPYYNCVHSIYVHTCIWKHVNDISSKSSK
jgi:hypothetical protein